VVPVGVVRSAGGDGFCHGRSLVFGVGILLLLYAMGGGADKALVIVSRQGAFCCLGSSETNCENYVAILGSGFGYMIG
jgi:hypothetical protein